MFIKLGNTLLPVAHIQDIYLHINKARIEVTLLDRPAVLYTQAYTSLVEAEIAFAAIEGKLCNK